MSTLDRYIIRTFLINFVVLSAVFTCLFVVVDLILDIDEFINAGKVFAEDYGGVLPATLAKMAEWYFPLILLIYANASGLIVVCAMSFTLVQLHRARELIALLASGVSMYRIAAPILVAGFFLNTLTFPVQELVIPRFADKLARSKHHIKYRTGRNYPVRYAADAEGNLLSASRFINTEDRLELVTILRRDEQGAAIGRISADDARWVDAFEPTPQSPPEEAALAGRGGWFFPGMGGYEVMVQGSGQGGADKGLAELSIAEPRAIQFFPTSLSPRVLMARRATMLPKLLSMQELREMRDNPAVDMRQRSRITQNIWSRFSMQVVNVLLLVMGMPFFLLRRPRNLMLQSMKAAGVCVGAWGNGLVMLSTAGAIPPEVAAWLPVVIYLPVAAVLLLRVET